MRKKYQKGYVVQKHLEKNRQKYLFSLCCIGIGLVLGGLFLSVLKPEESEKLMSFVSTFFETVKTKDLSEISIWSDALWDHLRIALLVWISGFSVYLLPLPPLLLLIKGFVLGFSVSFFSLHLGWKGFLLGLTLALPQVTLYLPALLFLSVLAITTALERKRRRNSSYPDKSMRLYTAKAILASFLLLLCAAADTLMVPIWVQHIGTFF